jgi:hypothetical protein
LINVWLNLKTIKFYFTSHRFLVTTKLFSGWKSLILKLIKNKDSKSVPIFLYSKMLLSYYYLSPFWRHNNQIYLYVPPLIDKPILNFLRFFFFVGATLDWISSLECEILLMWIFSTALVKWFDYVLSKICKIWSGNTSRYWISLMICF